MHLSAGIAWQYAYCIAQSECVCHGERPCDWYHAPADLLYHIIYDMAADTARYMYQ